MSENSAAAENHQTIVNFLLMNQSISRSEEIHEENFFQRNEDRAIALMMIANQLAQVPVVAIGIMCETDEDAEL